MSDQFALGPFSRAGAVETSAQAAAAVAPVVPDRQLAVLRAIRRSPASADEVAARLGRSVLGIRPRVSELHKAGLIAPTEIRVRTESGQSAAVWYCTAAGIDALESIDAATH